MLFTKGIVTLYLGTISQTQIIEQFISENVTILPEVDIKRETAFPDNVTTHSCSIYMISSEIHCTDL